VRYVVRVGEGGGYPFGANYGCWEEERVKRWRRKGKTLYVVVEKGRRRRRRNKGLWSWWWPFAKKSF